MTIGNIQMAKKVARILSLDGGGIRGLIPATILQGWESQIGAIAPHFHMVTGTSTGGILACALTGPKLVKATDLVKMYHDRGPEIFSGSWTTLGGVTGQLYDATSLQKVIDETLSGTLADVKTDLLVTSYDIENRSPYLFKSWKARGFELGKNEVGKSFDFALKDVARATSAAPTYFSPAKISPLKGAPVALVDGGVFANNPAMCAYVAARRLYPKADEYIIVSIGTGTLVKPVKYDDAKDYGLVGWARPLLDIMFDGVSSTTDYELSQLPQVTQYRFQTSLVGASESMDDTSPENLESLINVARGTAKKYDAQMLQAMIRLKEPITSLEDLGYPTKLSPVKPGIQVVSQASIKPKTTTITATGGALAGAVVAGPPGAIVGGGLGWLLGKAQDWFTL